MSNSFGVNVDTWGHCDPQEVYDSGASWVRVVLTSHGADTVFSYATAGLDVLGVIARESLAVDDDTLDFREAAAFYLDQCGEHLTAIQVGNEPFNDSPSSWTMSAADVNDLAWCFANAFPIPIISPGFADGQPEVVLPQLDLSLFDGIAVHPYGRAPRPNWPHETFGYVGELLDRYSDLGGGKPLWITEYGTDDQFVQADYIREMTETLASRRDVAASFAFCWADWMVSGYGLVDVHDNPKPSYHAFRSVAKETDVPQFVLGFAEYAKQHPEVGEPLEDEQSLGPGYQSQMTTNGFLIYSKAANAIQFYPKG